MLAHARCAEIVALAADGDDERIVTKAAPRGHLVTLLVDVGGQLNFTPLPVQADHLANAVAEVVPMRLREVVDLVHGEIHGSRSDLVQQRLP